MNSLNLWISNERLTFRQMKLTVKSEGEIAKNYNFWLNLFLWFRINHSRNCECFDQSCVNRTETVYGTLRLLLLLSPIVWNDVWKSSIRIGIFQRATQPARILLTGNTQSGGSSSVNYYKLLYCTMCYLFFFTKKEFGKRFLFIQILLSKKKILLAILYYYYCQLLVLLLTKMAAFSRGCKSRITLITE